MTWAQRRGGAWHARDGRRGAAQEVNMNAQFLTCCSRCISVQQLRLERVGVCVDSIRNYPWVTTAVADRAHDCTTLNKCAECAFKTAVLFCVARRTLRRTACDTHGGHQTKHEHTRPPPPLPVMSGPPGPSGYVVPPSTSSQRQGLTHSPIRHLLLERRTCRWFSQWPAHT